MKSKSLSFNTAPKQKQENAFLNITLNIIIPAIILMRFSTAETLGEQRGLIIALAFPLIYGIYDLIYRKKYNFFSVIGFISILLTGGIGLLRLDPFWIAIKEAGIPLLFGLGIIIAYYVGYPFVHMLLLQVIDAEKVKSHLSKKKEKQYNDLMLLATYLLAASFLVSAVLNYILARWIVQSPAGTAAFNEELGRMTALAFPVIVLPMTIALVIIIFYVMHRIAKITGLRFEELFKQQ
ncbi:MAG: VC0807 family protein [Candidatus Woesearchaeota archaeon]